MSTQAIATTSSSTSVSPNDSAATLPASQTPSALTTPPEIAHQYTYLDRIGEGAQGNVFRAKDLLHGGRDVAIKQLRIASVSNWKAYDLFQRESQVLSSLNIPGVAKFYETCEFLDTKSPSAYIVQEFIEGKTLADHISAGTRFPVQQICQIIIQILEILQKLHSHDPIVIHRDIKPSNIILTPDGRVYLIDFGAVANPQVQGGGSTVAGTYGYMAPEQLMGNPIPASDIYSLATTAIHLFSGVSPENMDNEDFHLLFEPHTQSLPIALTYTLRAMLHPDAKQRLCDIPELIHIFTEFEKGNYDIPLAVENCQEIQNTRVSMKDRVFHKKLSQVNDLRAPGNADLWHRLPNKTPRKVPLCYRFISSSDMLSFWSERSLQNMGVVSGTKHHEFLVRWLKYTFFLIICYHKAIKGAEDEDNYFLYFFNKILHGWFLLFYPIAVIISVWLSIYFIYSTYGTFLLITGILAFIKTRQKGIPKFMPVSGETSKVKDKPHPMAYYRSLIEKIVRTGSKTIATIDKIQYISQTDSIYKDMTLDKADTNTLVCTKTPLFKIRYRFNPEDDKNPNNLYHEIYTHTPPENHYTVGDPLPILYLVIFSSHTSVVYSIPFPLPVREHLDLALLIGNSEYDFYGSRS